MKRIRKSLLPIPNTKIRKDKKLVGWWDCDNTIFLHPDTEWYKTGHCLAMLIHEAVHAIFQRDVVCGPGLAKKIRGFKPNQYVMKRCHKAYDGETAKAMCYDDMICDIISSHIVLSLPQEVGMHYDYDAGYISKTQLKRWIKSGLTSRVYNKFMDRSRKNFIYEVFKEFASQKRNRRFRAPGLDEAMQEALE
jgi:hypothetical protein